MPLLSALRVAVDGLHLEPTGRFPRDPRERGLLPPAERLRRLLVPRDPDDGRDVIFTMHNLGMTSAPTP